MSHGLGFGGFQGVKFKFVIPHVQVNIKMLQVNSYNSLVNKTDSGQVRSPRRLPNKKGLVNWQDSVLNRWHNAQSPLCMFLSSSWPHVHLKRGKSNCESLCHYIKSQNKISILCLFSDMAEDSKPSSPLKRRFSLSSSYDFGLGWQSRVNFFLSLRVSLTHCQCPGLSQTTAPGSVSHYAEHTRWRLCSRSSTGPRSGCWKPSAYASAAPSDGHLLYRYPPAETGRCPVYRTFLLGRKEGGHRGGRYTITSYTIMLMYSVS